MLPNFVNNSRSFVGLTTFKSRRPINVRAPSTCQIRLVCGLVVDGEEEEEDVWGGRDVLLDELSRTLFLDIPGLGE